MRIVEPASALPASSGSLSLAGEAGVEASIEGASGASESTVKARLAGLWSVFAAWSVARTSNVWAPSVSAAAAVWASPGPEQGPKAAASKRHWKLEPGSEEEKLNDGVLSEVVPEGPESIVVSGAVESSV